MAALAPTAPDSRPPAAWFWQFLKEELSPYPGRFTLVARMVLATTVVMIMNMTFRIPFSAYGAVYALTISRESARSTAEDVKAVVIAFTVGAAEVLAGAVFFVDYPVVRFLFVIGNLFLMFFALTAMADFVTAARFGYLVVITIPLWDRNIPVELRVEGTLWAVGAVGGASIITLLLELAFAEWSPENPVLRSLTNRLAAVEKLLAAYSENRPLDPAEANNLGRLAVVGTSRQRRILQRSGYAPQFREQMGAAVALSGRLIDLAANLTDAGIEAGERDRQRIRALAGGIAEIRTALLAGAVPHRAAFGQEGEPPSPTPLLREMETTVSLIPEVFSGSRSLSAYALSPIAEEPKPGIFLPDAFTNPEHLKFALKGCLAASLCYFIYNALFWPGLSTAVTTCLLTALTTVGASHQKQVLRFAGAIAGGFGIGMGAQVFVLPYLDSIGAFTVLFASVAALSAWIATSGPRLSYFGVQVAVAFFLINLSEFKIQTSLTDARDRVVGILLGLLMMWLVFDRLWSVPAGIQMRRTFIATLRLLAQLAREPVSANPQTAIPAIYSLRDTINKNFDQVRALADGVLFEFGASRARDLALRDRIRQWQPQLRSFFLIRNTLIKYRLELPGFELPEPVRAAQREFDERQARILEGIADRMEGIPGTREAGATGSFVQLEEAARKAGPQEFAAHLQTFLPLSRKIEDLIVSLDAGLA